MVFAAHPGHAVAGRDLRDGVAAHGAAGEGAEPRGVRARPHSAAGDRAAGGVLWNRSGLLSAG